LARTLLSRRDTKGSLPAGKSVYAKWQGAHWALAALADIGYPQGDPSLFPAKDLILNHWLSPNYFTQFETNRKAEAYQKAGIPRMRGRYGAHASQQGYALYFLTRLGLGDLRLDALVERLLHWRWPNGGWNCDKNPQASHSSFTETLLPMKGLFVYSQAKKDKSLRKAAHDAAEIFLRRGLFKRVTNGRVMNLEFTFLHYPLYWHYDILAGLKAMAEMGLARDPRCGEAQDWLEAKQLLGGGWPAEMRYYRVSKKIQLGTDDFNWGGTGRKVLNEWVTTDALYVLRVAGRIEF
jgi:hypothetical protein